ncbi:hypothetical protein ACWD4J_09670 [Streptomyces sp. NPDC002577]
MTVRIRFTNGECLEYADQGGGTSAYCYATGANGTLLVYERSGTGRPAREGQPLAVYSPSAWFSVSGAPWAGLQGTGSPGSYLLARCNVLPR